MKYPPSIDDPYGLNPNNLSRKAIHEASKKGIFKGFPKRQSNEIPEPEVFLVNNFTLEYESTTNDFIRWFKQVQKNHDDYQFEITIKAIPKDNQ